jgi:hypothetical protein
MLGRSWPPERPIFRWIRANAEIGPPPLDNSDFRVLVRMPTPLTCGFAFAGRGYPQVYRGNFSGPYQNRVMHATQGWRTAPLQHAAGFGNSSRLSPRCPKLPYRSPTQLPDQLLEYRRGTAGTAVDHSYRRTQVI